MATAAALALITACGAEGDLRAEVDREALATGDTVVTRGTFSRGGLMAAATYLPQPGIKGFYYRFTNGDHHVHRIMAGHFFEAGALNWGLQYLEWSDISQDDPYDYRLTEQQLPQGTISCAWFDDGASFAGPPECQSPGADWVPVIVGFDYRFNRADHHLKTIDLYQAPDGTMAGGMWDVGTGFPFSVRNFSDQPSMAWALVPRSAVRGFGTITGGRARGSMSGLFSAVNPVLTGFKFTFVNGDHHVDQIGVELSPGTFQHWFNDNDNADEYEWTIWYVDLY